jgi:predicted nucleic acid-binding protein
MYSVRPDQDNPDILLDYAFGHVARLIRPDIHVMHPRAALSSVGIAETMQNAILDPQHAQVSQTQSLQYWVRNTLRINSLTLEMHTEQLKVCTQFSFSFAD